MWKSLVIFIVFGLVGCSGKGPVATPSSSGQAQDTDRASVAGVLLAKTANRWHLVRDGQEYLVKGVGGSEYLNRLQDLGANSIRTWDSKNLQSVLDSAHQYGLTVCAGIWLGHQRHGFNYHDERQVAEQREMVREAVTRFKDHPALLMWGLGNEMEGLGAGDDDRVWKEVDELAAIVKSLDPNHPTMTVIAEIGGERVSAVHECEYIDIVGINSYAGAASLPDRYREAGGTKPFILTEFGPHGPWEVSKTSWGAPIEATSTEKAAKYADAYRRAVLESGGLCLGSYAFLWGHKQETTATWFGMLLPNGARLAAIDTLAELWTGEPPENLCPRIEKVAVDRSNGLKRRETLSATIRATDPDDDPLRIQWVLRYDSTTLSSGGDAQAEEVEFLDAVKSEGAQATVTVPEQGGAYRLFAYVFDDHSGAAVANVPLYVDAPIKPLPSPRATLPFVVYSEGAEGRPYIASGYMGKTDAIRLDANCIESPFSGQNCLKVEFQAAGDWGGVLWQSPANDWQGNKPGGLDLTGATELEFYARGGIGGEKVNFVFGSLDGDQLYHDTAKGELKDVVLTTEWRRLSIPLSGDLSRIKTAFGWSLEGSGKPVVFYLDEVRYLGSPSPRIDSRVNRR